MISMMSFLRANFQILEVKMLTSNIWKLAILARRTFKFTCIYVLENVGRQEHSRDHNTRFVALIETITMDTLGYSQLLCCTFFHITLLIIPMMTTRSLTASDYDHYWGITVIFIELPFMGKKHSIPVFRSVLLADGSLILMHSFARSDYYYS